MTEQTAIELAALAISASLGANIAFWCCVGLARLVVDSIWQRAPIAPSLRLKVADTAAIIPAHNEERALPRCLAALTAIMPANQIYVASDGSRDSTVAIARAAGCNVLDIHPNGGKAKALDRAIREFDLCQRYQVVLIQDADSEIDPLYLDNALPLFDDPDVVVVAGHVLSRWREQRWPSRDMLYAAYRTRLYRLLQAAFQYGMSWRWFSLSYIAPGFASMYRARALQRISITAPGLVIEDFNMTFEVQHDRLGRIAYSPQARCSSEDPIGFNDYRKQVQRWYLGFWQTVHRHGVWPSLFWLALGGLLIELLAVSLLSLSLPVWTLAWLVGGISTPAFSLLQFDFRAVSPLDVVALFLAVDYALTIVVAVIDRRPSLLIYGLAFPFLRLLDSALFLGAFVKSFSVSSDGRWISPERSPAIGRPATSPTTVEIAR